jgi:phage terminase large subunit
MLTFEAGHKILFTRLTMVSANISIIPELVDKIDLLGLSEHFRITKTEIINTTSGSSIIFMGIRSSNGDNTARLKSISGITTNCRRSRRTY